MKFDRGQFPESLPLIPGATLESDTEPEEDNDDIFDEIQPQRSVPFPPPQPTNVPQPTTHFENLIPPPNRPIGSPALVGPQLPVDVIGAPPRNLDFADQFCTEGSSEFVIGVSEGQQDVFFEELAKFDTLHQATQIRADVALDLENDSLLLDTILIEVLAASKLIEDYDIIVLSPSRDLWRLVREQLSCHITNFALDHGPEYR